MHILLRSCFVWGSCVYNYCYFFQNKIIYVLCNKILHPWFLSLSFFFFLAGHWSLLSTWFKTPDWGCQEGSRVPWRVMSTVFSILFGVLLFSYKIAQWLLAWACLVSGWDPERRSSNKLSVWERILAVGGGHWRRGPDLVLQGWPPGSSFLWLPEPNHSHAAGGPGNSESSGLQTVWPKWESGLATRKLRYQGRGWPWGDGRGGEALPWCSALLQELILEVEPRRPRWSWASFEARMWAGGNLGCSASPASMHGRVLGWWEQGQLASAPICEEILGVRSSCETYKIDL